MWARHDLISPDDLHTNERNEQNDGHRRHEPTGPAEVTAQRGEVASRLRVGAD